MFLTIIHITIEKDWSLPFVILSLFYIYLTVILNQSLQERKEQRHLYEQLLGEYRRLKRMHFESERVARLEERTKIARVLLILAKIVPITYGMEVLKGATVYNYSFTELLYPISILILMTVVMMGIGINIVERRDA